MRFKILAIAVMVLGLMVVIALAADVDGTWVSEFQGRGGQSMTITYTFKAEGSTLTGTVSSPMGGEPTAISDGKINGDEISFSVKREMGGNSMTMNYKGKVAGDEIKLTMEMEGGMGGPGGGGPGGKPMEFTLKRQK
jgi:hypothetical protein